MDSAESLGRVWVSNSQPSDVSGLENLTYVSPDGDPLSSPSKPSHISKLTNHSPMVLDLKKALPLFPSRQRTELSRDLARSQPQRHNIFLPEESARRLVGGSVNVTRVADALFEKKSSQNVRFNLKRDLVESLSDDESTLQTLKQEGIEESHIRKRKGNFLNDFKALMGSEEPLRLRSIDNKDKKEDNYLERKERNYSVADLKDDVLDNNERFTLGIRSKYLKDLESFTDNLKAFDSKSYGTKDSLNGKSTDLPTTYSKPESSWKYQSIKDTKGYLVKQAPLNDRKATPPEHQKPDSTDKIGDEKSNPERITSAPVYRDSEGSGQSNKETSSLVQATTSYDHLPFSKRLFLDPQIPAMLSLYIQILLNFLLGSAFVAFIILVIWTIKNDIDNRINTELLEISQEISLCSREYTRNHCAPDTRVPALEQSCMAWEKCMSRDPKLLSTAKLGAETFAEILNGFIKPMSWKSFFFMFFGVFGSLVMNNVVLGGYRQPRGRRLYIDSNNDVYVEGEGERSRDEGNDQNNSFELWSPSKLTLFSPSKVFSPSKLSTLSPNKYKHSPTKPAGKHSSAKFAFSPIKTPHKTGAGNQYTTPMGKGVDKNFFNNLMLFVNRE